MAFTYQLKMNIPEISNSGHAYFDELENKPCPFSMDKVAEDDERQAVWAKEREVYGFDSTETWDLNSAFYAWLYEHLRMYVDKASDVVNLHYHKFKWKDEELSQISGLEMQLEISKEDSIRQTFPQGYHAYLIALNAKHPNWTFVPYNTGLDWNTVLNEEHVGNRSLVYKTSDDSWKSKEAGDYDAATGTYVGKSGANWYRASIEGISYCMNPQQESAALCPGYIVFPAWRLS